MLQQFINTNMILNIVITVVILWLLKECFTLHMGPVFAYSNAHYVMALIVVLSITTMHILKCNIILDKYGIVIGIIIFTILIILNNIITKKYEETAEKLYRERRRINMSDINIDNLKALITECEENNIELTNRRCSCKCKFGDKKPSKDNEQCFNFDGEYTENPDECITLCGCGNVKCSVFNTIVDYSTGCVWSEQDTYESYGDKKCLLSKIETNEQLKELIGNLQNE